MTPRYPYCHSKFRQVLKNKGLTIESVAADIKIGSGNFYSYETSGIPGYVVELLSIKFGIQLSDYAPDSEPIAEESEGGEEEIAQPTQVIQIAPEVLKNIMGYSQPRTDRVQDITEALTIFMSTATMTNIIKNAAEASAEVKLLRQEIGGIIKSSVAAAIKDASKRKNNF